MASAMVLCAGFGTRLGAVSSFLPKPLVPIGDEPAVGHVLRALRPIAPARVVLNAHHRAADLSAWVRRSEGEARAVGLELAVVCEAEILGTAGGVKHAERELGAGGVLVWNGDILAAELDPRAVLAALEASAAEAVWVVAPRPRGQGTVGLGRDGQILRVRGRVFGEEVCGGDYLGVQALGPSLRARLPARGCLVGDVALPALERGVPLAAFPYDGPWCDIGDPSMLLAANRDWLHRRGLTEWVGPRAEVHPSVVLESTVVSPGARVEGRGRLRNCLVLPESRAQAPGESRIYFADQFLDA